ncbi:MAG: hypothetical protein PF692_00790 [Kiritimatiellae bacterium]|jgi:hypothetical protein|nr:hypothetical protein [Kiritimatiellia bacterium]
MKKICFFIAICAMFFSFTKLYAAENISPVQSTISGDPAQGVTTISTSFETALDVTANVPAAANVLVLSTFSLKSNKTKSTYMLWKLTYGAQESVTMRRYLSGTSDTGSASAAHLFTNVTQGNQTFNLNFASSTSQEITLFGANLCAIPMVTDEGSIMSSSMASISAKSAVSSTTYTDVGLVTTVSVDRVANDNSIFMAAAVNSSSDGDAVEGMWRFEIRSIGGTWADTGIETRRNLSGSNDLGAISLFGLAPNLTNGKYEIRVTSKSLTDAVTVNTLNSTLASFALSYTNSTASGYFPAKMDSAAQSVNSATTWTPIPGLNSQLSHTSSSVNAFAALSMAGSTYAGANQTGHFRISCTNNTGFAQQSVGVKRFFTGTDDWGSMGIVSLVTNIPAGASSFIGEKKRSAGATLTDYPVITSFLTSSEDTYLPKRGTLNIFD